MTSTTRKYKDSELDIVRTYHGYSTYKYTVTLLSGEWPSDGELISLCDGNDGKFRNDFGGFVEPALPNSKIKTVSVYVD